MKPMPNTKRPCGCRCIGCVENMHQHCLTAPCTRQRNRRTQAVIATHGRYSDGTVRPNPAWRRHGNPNRISSYTKMIDRPAAPRWQVNASRNGKQITLSAADQVEAQRITDNLTRQGWVAQPESL